MARKKQICAAAIFFLILSGCANLNSNTPFRYLPALLAQTNTIDKTASVIIFRDSRPKEDIASTKNITDFAEKVTEKITQDLKESNIFKEVHYGLQPNDDFSISGTIDRFIWKLHAHPLSFIPLLCYLGTPAFIAYGIAAITLEIKDHKTGQVLAVLKESTEVKNSFTVYDFKVSEKGTELEDAFRETVRKLKESLLVKLNPK